MTGWLINDGIGIHWREDGPAKAHAILFLNSLGTDMRLWDRVVDVLSANYRCIRMDTRGHGLSDAPDGAYSLEDITKDSETLLDHLAIREVTVVGVSLGGMIAQNLSARRKSQVTRAVFANTAPLMGTQEMWAARIDAVKSGGLTVIAGPILDRWFSSAFLKSTEIGLWQNMLTRTPESGYVGCCHALARTDLTDIVSGLVIPALVVAGSEDQASPPELVEAFASTLPNSQYELLPGIGHLPMAEDPNAFSALVANFIAGDADG